MTGAVLPNPSAGAEWFLAGIIDRALDHWCHAPILDGGNGDDDNADSETDTPIPDDDDDDHDVGSLASQPSLSLRPSSLGNLELQAEMRSRCSPDSQCRLPSHLIKSCHRTR